MLQNLLIVLAVLLGVVWLVELINNVIITYTIVRELKENRPNVIGDRQVIILSSEDPDTIKIEGGETADIETAIEELLAEEEEPILDEMSDDFFDEYEKEDIEDTEN